ncbi:MAG: hypothetical protein IJI14_20890 [Anaerolineaceae bacterium]|nr:hypothetical protein [Anaerolineaceae bacterium]
MDTKKVRKTLVKSAAEDIAMILPLVFVSAAVLLVFSSSTSPLYPYNYGIDSAFNRFVGLNLLRGKTLYRDIWDHKGPLLFLIQAVGAIGGTRNTGPSMIFFLQLFSLTFSLFFIWKSFLLIVKEKKKAVLLFFICLLPSLMAFSKTIEGGNLNEEWCLPFISCGLYFSLRYDCSGNVRHPFLFAFIPGISCGAITFVRVNNAIPVCCAAAAAAVYSARKDGAKSILRNILFFAAGFMVPAVPVIVFFAVNGTLGEMIYAAFLHNLKYMGSVTHISLNREGLVLRHIPLFSAAALISASFLRKKKADPADMILSAAAVGTGLMLAYSNTYLHYFTIFIPVFALICMKHIRVETRRGKFCAAAMILIFSGVYIRELPGRIDRPVYTYVSTIPKEEKNSMIAIWTSPEIYLNSGLMPVSRFSSYQNKYFPVNGEMKEEFISDILEKEPLRIMVQSGRVYDLYPEIRELIGNCYEFEQRDGDADIYRKTCSSETQPD